MARDAAGERTVVDPVTASLDGAGRAWTRRATTCEETLVQPGQPDMQMILQQAQKMQEQLMTAQAELAEAEVTGQAGNGLVQVTTTAAGEVRAVRIDPKVVDPEDVETLQDLVVGALQDAAQGRAGAAGREDGPAGRRPGRRRRRPRPARPRLGRCSRGRSRT